MSRLTIALFLALVLLQSVSARFFVKQHDDLPVRRCGVRLIEWMQTALFDCPKQPRSEEGLSFKDIIASCCIIGGCSASEVRDALC